MKKIRTNLLYLLVFLLVPFFAEAQARGKTAKSEFTEAHFDALQWRLVGPFRGGRAGTVAGVADQPNLYYMGTAGGGVWKTEDRGNTWSCISDGYFGGSIGAVAVAESDPNVIYVGEGEQTLRGNVSSGRGLWRSTDAGKTWNFIGLKDSEHIGRIRVHPKNPDLVYVAAIGNLWKPSDMRGVYRSKDGGQTWERILFESDKAGAVDLILDPNNPRIIYASTWQMKRNGYRMDSGGPGSKLWKSTDGGDTWTDITRNPGLPQGVNGIIGVAVSPQNSERIWTIIENQQGGVFRSDDGGETWRKTSADRNLRQRAWYYSRIYADPQREDMVYVANVGFWVSKDGGQNFDRIGTPHSDHHDLWINPDDNETMIVANDGGAQVSYDQGANWTTMYNQPTAQFYRVTTDNHFPFRIYGAQQDNSSIRINHRGKGSAITERDWEPSAGGESAHLAPDPKNPDIVYGGTYKGYMMRLDHSTGQVRSTNVWPDNPAGSGAEIMKYRFNWNYPVAFSPHDPNKLYAGSNYLHVTYNGGQSWEVISPDLSRNDPETIKSSGGPITQDNTGAEFYANIFVITESPLEKDLIWIGTDDGKLWVTKDGGDNWNDVTPTGPRLNMMNCIDVHPTKEGVAYVAATSYKFGDYTPYLYKTTNYGKSWEVITDGIPENYYTRAIRADKTRDGLLYAGTEWGMFVSFDDGDSWTPFQLNLPITAIRDLQVRDNMLIAATHGRSFWMIDDLTPLHQLDADIVDADFFLFQPKPAYRMAQGGGWGGADHRLEGENHPNGVLFHYMLNEMAADEEVTLQIRELDDDLITTFSNQEGSLSAKKGGHRFVWDMRYPGFKEFPGMVLYSSPNRGPKAPPGTYKAVLKIGEEEVVQEFEIIGDPRLPNTEEDYEEQFDYLLKVRDEVSQANQAILDIRALKKDINYLKEKIAENPEADELENMLNVFTSDMEVIENNVHMTKNESYQDPLNYGIRINNRLAFLLADQQRGDFPPTDQAMAFFTEVKAELEVELKDLDELIETELPKINEAAKPFGIQLISPRKKLGNP
ncbi:MAG TPA: hypothetical protein VJ953_13005 [Saprospiraceae bacterium]|nr:hypothetical protein [Saprospiraceae bacterium]